MAEFAGPSSCDAASSVRGAVRATGSALVRGDSVDCHGRRAHCHAIGGVGFSYLRTPSSLVGCTEWETLGGTWVLEIESPVQCGAQIEKNVLDWRVGVVD